MEDYFYLIVACLIGIELFYRLQFISNVIAISNCLKKVLRIIPSSSISDHWKEKIVPKYSLIILKKSLFLLAILLLIILVFSAFILFSNNYIGLVLSIEGGVISIVISYTYSKLRLILNNE